MPTRINTNHPNDPPSASSTPEGRRRAMAAASETAETSEYDWFARAIQSTQTQPAPIQQNHQQQHHHQSQQWRQGGVNDDTSDEDDNDSDTTASGSRIQAALDDLQERTQKGGSGGGKTRDDSLRLDNNDDETSTLLLSAGNDLAEDEEEENTLNNSNSSFQLSPRRVENDQASSTRRMAGPREREYRETYEPYVTSKIQTFQAKQSANAQPFRDYRTMNATEKEQEQQHVMKLLVRLGIGASPAATAGNMQQQQQQLAVGNDLDPDATVDPSLVVLATADDSVVLYQHDDDDDDDDDNDETVDPSFQEQHILPSATTGRTAGITNNKSVSFAANANTTGKNPGHNSSSRSLKRATAVQQPEENNDTTLLSESICLLDGSDTIDDSLCLLSPMPTIANTSATTHKNNRDESNTKNKALLAAAAYPAAAGYDDDPSGDDDSFRARRDGTSSLGTKNKKTLPADAAAAAGYDDSSSDSSSRSTVSVEVSRAARRYESPSSNTLRQGEQRKRQASTSGKRGTDLARRCPRNGSSRNSEASHNDDGDYYAGNNNTLDSPAAADYSKTVVQDQEPHSYFAASQSPISPHSQTMVMDRDDDEHSPGAAAAYAAPDISFGEDNDSSDVEKNNDNNYGNNNDDDKDSSDADTYTHTTNAFNNNNNNTTVNDSILYTTTANSGGREGHNNPLGDMNRRGVALKEGATFHLNPLATRRNHHLGQQRSRRSRAIMSSSFPDPLCEYQGREGRRLGRVYQKLQQRDMETDPAKALAIVLSLENPSHICAVVLKLLLENNNHYQSDEPSSSSSQNSNNNNCTPGGGGGGSCSLCKGQTLIVARDREDLEEWSRAFREQTSFSVLNHTALPIKQRKTPTTVEKCIQYDVVLTTFDALKSPDVAVSLDENGHVMTKKVGFEDGWFTSRSSVSQSSQPLHQTKQQSVLHLASWRRVVFVDCVGRKSYLAKSGTSRALAAKSLNSTARLLFFTGAEGEGKEDTMKDLVNSDKSAMQSLASMLRIAGDRFDVPLLRDITFDLNDKPTKKK